MLKDKGYEVSHLGRSRNSKARVKTWLWSPGAGTIEEGALEGVTDIIHLAGAGIADKRWSEARKKLIIRSRTDGPALLHQELSKRNQTLKSFVSASGVNYYGTVTQENTFQEDDPAGDDFTAECCLLWEEGADLFQEMARVVKMRIGVVMGRTGGALPRIARPVEFGVGSALGSGKQFVPWVHIEDVCRAFVYALENEALEGPYNTVAPEHLTNRELTKAIAKRRRMPLIMPKVPAFMLKMIFGEMSSLVLNGTRISSERLTAAGFSFNHPTIEGALENLYPPTFPK